MLGKVLLLLAVGGVGIWSSRPVPLLGLLVSVETPVTKESPSTQDLSLRGELQIREVISEDQDLGSSRFSFWCYGQFSTSLG